MPWCCVEQGRLISILPYLPTVPPTVRITEISDHEYQQIQQGTHWFNVDTAGVEPVPQQLLQREQQGQSDQIARQWLASTDWQVLRHIREQALGLPTSLTQAQYLDLEQQRQQAAKNIGISPFSSNNG